MLALLAGRCESLDLGRMVRGGGCGSLEREAESSKSCNLSDRFALIQEQANQIFCFIQKLRDVFLGPDGDG